MQLLAAAVGANLARTVATRDAHPVRAVLLARAGPRAGARPEPARGPRPGSDDPDQRPARLLDAVGAARPAGHLPAGARRDGAAVRADRRAGGRHRLVPGRRHPGHVERAGRQRGPRRAGLPGRPGDAGRAAGPERRLGAGRRAAPGLGIGINTGPAQVGNTGSSRKFKYGPLGNTVNLASRVEGATKHLKVPVLITGSTRAELGDAFATRRLCQVRVVGIHGAVELYELHGETASPEWLADRDAYEKALGPVRSRGSGSRRFRRCSPCWTGRSRAATTTCPRSS